MVLLTIVVNHAHLMLSLQKQILLYCDENLKLSQMGLWGRLVFRERMKYVVELSKLVCYYQFPLEDGTREARETQLFSHWRQSMHLLLLDTKVFNNKEHSWQHGLCSLSAYQAVCLFTVVLSSWIPDLNVSSTGLPTPSE